MLGPVDDGLSLASIEATSTQAIRFDKAAWVRCMWHRNSEPGSGGHNATSSTKLLERPYLRYVSLCRIHRRRHMDHPVDQRVMEDQARLARFHRSSPGCLLDCTAADSSLFLSRLMRERLLNSGRGRAGAGRWRDVERVIYR